MNYKDCIKKYLLIVLQALCVTVISACICIYAYFSLLQEKGQFDTYLSHTSISSFRSDYYDSELYENNLDVTIDEIIRYCVIKNQVEAEGEYDPDKIIYIGEYATRKSDNEYQGPRVGYYLKDLIAWGQYGVSNSGIAHSYKTFDSWEEMYSFFGRNGETEKNDKLFDVYGENEESVEINSYEEYDDYSDIYITEFETSNAVPMLDVIANRYLTVDGHTLEYYAYGESDYKALVSYLETTASSLYQNYTEYVDFNEYFSPDNTNIRFYVFDGNNAYTNDFDLRGLDESHLADRFKELGEYIHAMPYQYEYLSNTPIPFDYIANALINYRYAFGDNTDIWIGLDTSFPVDDCFSANYYAIKRTIALIPWVISFATIGVIGFVTLLVYIISTGKRRLSYENAGKDLKFIDKLPLEFELGIFAGIFLILYIIGILVFGPKNLRNSETVFEILNPVILVSFLFIFTFLLFFYSFLRRLITRTLFTNSYIVSFGKWVYRKSGLLQKMTRRVYNSTGMAVRTWAEYIFFLIFNTFWACMLFFSSIPVLSFFILLIFDAITGLVLFNRNYEKRNVIEAIKQINEGDFDFKLDLNKFHGSNRELAVTVNEIGDAMRKAVETSSKDERLKADLITNVSHDIKTPLTSIINYVDLIKRENIDNERVNKYVRILDEKSQRLKQLTIDLVEASKITSGNITLEINKINLLELLNQARGEFEDKYNEKQLTLVESKPETPVVIEADARYIWRVVENLFQNVYKYALDGTRVYLDVSVDKASNSAIIALKNISRQQLNINADELTERFIRGDLARSTEGSGLGLSIVKSLVKAHNGKFDVYLDGDLFKATVTLPISREE